MKAILLIVMAILPILLIGCGSKELTASKAKELVTAKFKKEGPVPGSTAFAVSVGKQPGGKATNLQQVLADKSQSGRFWKDLTDSGMIAVSWIGIEPIKDGASGKSAFVDVSLTPSGAAFKVAEANGYVVVKGCEKIIQDVTRISSTGNSSTAQIEYTWRFGNLTPFAKAIRENGGGALCDPQNIQQGHANLRRYDNGWKIES